jgi:pimeloyl-ACP methyl ester carboxylesterase
MVRAEEPWLRSNANLQQLPAVRSDVLVIVGEQDVDTPGANSRLLASRIPGDRMSTIAGAGHSVLFQLSGAGRCLGPRLPVR